PRGLHRLGLHGGAVAMTRAPLALERVALEEQHGGTWLLRAQSVTLNRRGHSPQALATPAGERGGVRSRQPVGIERKGNSLTHRVPVEVANRKHRTPQPTLEALRWCPVALTSRFGTAICDT